MIILIFSIKKDEIANSFFQRKVKHTAKSEKNVFIIRETESSNVFPKKIIKKPTKYNFFQLFVPKSEKIIFAL